MLIFITNKFCLLTVRKSANIIFDYIVHEIINNAHLISCKFFQMLDFAKAEGFFFLQSL